jgi:hypothetical protein
MAKNRTEGGKLREAVGEKKYSKGTTWPNFLVEKKLASTATKCRLKKIKSAYRQH